MAEASNFPSSQEESLDIDMVEINLSDTTQTKPKQLGTDACADLQKLQREVMTEHTSAENSFEQKRKNTISLSGGINGDDYDDYGSYLAALRKREIEILKNSQEEKRKTPQGNTDCGILSSSDITGIFNPTSSIYSISNEDWVVQMFNLHRDKDVAMILIEAEKERRKAKCDKDGKVDPDKDGRKLYYLVTDNRVYEIAEECYDFIYDQRRKEQKKEEAVLKEEKERQELYKFFRPSDNISYLIKEQLPVNRYPVLKATETETVKRANSNRVLKALSRVAQRCGKFFSCCRKRSADE